MAKFVSKKLLTDTVVGAYWAYLTYKKWEVVRLADHQAKEIQAAQMREEEEDKQRAQDREEGFEICRKLNNQDRMRLINQLD
jgi:hypothetical protein